MGNFCGMRCLCAKSLEYGVMIAFAVLSLVHRFSKFERCYHDLQLQLTHHPKVHQNGSFLIPMHHLALQVNSLELATSPLKKFTSQHQNSLQIIR